MTNRSFYVRAVWDPEEKIFFSESNIIGLHLETPTFEEFEEVLMDVAPDLIVANHLTDADLANKPLRDLVPAIVIEKQLAKAS
jgi:hypothetical protein